MTQKDALSNVYLTEQGDTWDLIAFKCYGKEAKMTDIMDENPEFANVAFFPVSIMLKIPVVKPEDKEGVPPWAK
jgi:phage tail protein X